MFLCCSLLGPPQFSYQFSIGDFLITSANKVYINSVKALNAFDKGEVVRNNTVRSSA